MFHFYWYIDLSSKDLLYQQFCCLRIVIFFLILFSNVIKEITCLFHNSVWQISYELWKICTGVSKEVSVCDSFRPLHGFLGIHHLMVVRLFPFFVSVTGYSLVRTNDISYYQFLHHHSELVFWHSNLPRTDELSKLVLGDDVIVVSDVILYE